MESLYNQLNLLRPPTTTWIVARDKFDSTIFVNTINKIYNELRSQDILNQEAALLSRLIYRMKRKFRHDKGLKNMEKVNRALLNYLQMSLDNEYKYLIDNTTVATNLVSLPTRQMLQYVLTRTQGFCKLMCRVEQVAKESAIFFRARIQMGQAWTVSAIAYAIMSRIWILSRHLVKKSCRWYNKLYPFLSRLKLIGINWMPVNYELPSNLQEWICVPWINEEGQCIPLNEHLSDSIFSLIRPKNQSDDEIDETEDLLRNVINNKQDDVLVKNVENGNISIVIDDVGEPISRESLLINSLRLPKSTRKLKKCSIKTVKTEDDLRLLLTFDSHPGLDKLQWNIVKKIIDKTLKKLNKCNSNKKRELLLKKIIRSLQEYID